MPNSSRVILQDKPSAAEIPVYWTIAGLFAGIGFLFCAKLVSTIPLLSTMFLLFALGSIALCALRALIDLTERQISMYTLTEDCLTVKRGFNQRINTIPIEHIQQILVRKPLLGQILNYGTLMVKAPGWSFAKISRVPDPEKWQAKILELRHRH